MKKFVTTVFLIFAAILLIAPQSGYAYPSWSAGCNTCHATAAGTGLHTISTHTNCGSCHAGGTPGKNVSPSACIVCHPAGDAGLCQLINKQGTGHGSTCLTCHSSDCAPATTTTTAAVTTTTTSTPAGPCPAEAVLGEDDPRLDTLRAFRDQVLAKNPNGQKMIKMYYDASAAVVQMMNKDPELRESARKYLESIMPTIEMMVKQKAGKK